MSIGRSSLLWIGASFAVVTASAWILTTSGAPPVRNPLPRRAAQRPDPRFTRWGGSSPRPAWSSSARVPGRVSLRSGSVPATGSKPASFWQSWKVTSKPRRKSHWRRAGERQVEHQRATRKAKLTLERTQLDALMRPASRRPRRSLRSSRKSLRIQIT